MKASAIPSALRDEIEHETGCVIASERPRGGGGASRQGAELTLQGPDGRVWSGYLAWDARAGDPSRLAYFRRETAILSALSGPFAGAGVTVAPLVASFPSHLALLSEFVSGNDRFAMADDKASVAGAFMAQLAALHSIDACDPAFAELGDSSEMPSRRIRENIARWQRDDLAAGGDPVFQVALAWVARNVPADFGPAVVLHGDAGPGNFLFDGDRIAALVDWELTHLGDPMEDLAQIWVRSLIQPFVPMDQVFAAYAQAGGQAIDLARIRFHRLYFQLSFSVPGKVMASVADSLAGASGTALMFGTMHRRVMVRSVAELTGVPLTEAALPAQDPDWTDRYFAAALDDLRNDIVPAASNERASAKAKDLARLVKFWRARARFGAASDAAEMADIRALMPSAPSELNAARAALAEAVAADAVDFAAAIQLCYNRVMRETAVMADAMGALATTWYETVSDDKG